MVLLGLILLIVGLLLFHPLVVIGGIILLVGLILFAVGGSGRSVGGRRYWY